MPAIPTPATLANEPPLCIDLDGTLVRTDTLAESLLGLLARSPLKALMLPAWLLAGRAQLKARLSGSFTQDPALLPYNQPLLEELAQQRSQGRKLILVTAADDSIARRIAAHLNLFDEVIASDAKVNLKGARKSEYLVERFGRNNFDYVGDCSADVPVWKAARHAYLAADNARSAHRWKDIQFQKIFGQQPASAIRTLPRVLRLHQWLKNALIFVPLGTSLSFFNVQLLTSAVIAFVLFGMTASSVYITNDLIDLPADRRHPRKRRRPFAAGDISPWTGLLLAPLLLMVSIGLSLALMPPLFTAVLLTYLVSTVAYTFYLKRIVLVDVMALASLYTLRIVAGGMAISIAISFWLLAFSIFLFLSLALIKRFTELKEAQSQEETWVAGRGYRASDLKLLMTMGVSAGQLAVLILALYIDSDDVKQLYAHPAYLWALCPLLLYWIARMWMQADRNNMHDDPLVFAAKDRVTYILGGLATAALVAALA